MSTPVSNRYYIVDGSPEKEEPDPDDPWLDEHPGPTGRYQSRYRSPSVNGGWVIEDVLVYVLRVGDGEERRRFKTMEGGEIGWVDEADRQWRGPLKRKREQRYSTETYNEASERLWAKLQYHREGLALNEVDLSEPFPIDQLTEHNPEVIEWISEIQDQLGYQMSEFQASWAVAQTKSPHTLEDYNDVLGTNLRPTP